MCGYAFVYVWLCACMRLDVVSMVSRFMCGYAFVYV